MASARRPRAYGPRRSPSCWKSLVLNVTMFGHPAAVAASSTCASSGSSTTGRQRLYTSCSAPRVVHPVPPPNLSERSQHNDDVAVRDADQAPDRAGALRCIRRAAGIRRAAAPSDELSRYIMSRPPSTWSRSSREVPCELRSAAYTTFVSKTAPAVIVIFSGYVNRIRYQRSTVRFGTRYSSRCSNLQHWHARIQSMLLCFQTSGEPPNHDS